jgi:hypothetical protein
VSRREFVSRPVPGSALVLLILGLACVVAGVSAGAGTHTGRVWAVASLILIGLAWIVARVRTRR